MTETESFPSADLCTVNPISLEAFTSPTPAEIAPLHCKVRLSELAFAVEFFAANSTSGL
ncbi:hypothetical protein [Bradyrhizobium sp. LB11.1]|uniref:hypothetical protein n=1 Tax=Bradyrhizobium sp. LB11.1 TaxID=3156326 RepID=UPI003394CD92